MRYGSKTQNKVRIGLFKHSCAISLFYVWHSKWKYRHGDAYFSYAAQVRFALLCSWSHFKLINFNLFFFGNPILKDLSNNPLIWRIIRKLNHLQISNELQQRGYEFKQRRNYLRNFVFFMNFAHFVIYPESCIW